MTVTFRVDWVPGTDQLLGTCHCGATCRVEDPIEVWEWLLAHPEGHEAPGHPVGDAGDVGDRQPCLTHRS